MQFNLHLAFDSSILCQDLWFVKIPQSNVQQIFSFLPSSNRFFLSILINRLHSLCLCLKNCPTLWIPVTDNHHMCQLISLLWCVPCWSSSYIYNHFFFSWWFFSGDFFFFFKFWPPNSAYHFHVSLYTASTILIKHN